MYRDWEGEEPKSNTIEEEEVSEGEFTMLDAMVLEAEADAARLKQFQESMIVDQNQKIPSIRIVSILSNLITPQIPTVPAHTISQQPARPRCSQSISI